MTSRLLNLAPALSSQRWALARGSRLLGLVLSAVLLSACAVGPDYQRPELTAAQQQKLLALYSMRRRYPDRRTAERLAANLPQRLQLAKCLYSGFCWLWYQATPGLHQSANSWQQRLQQLLQSEAPESFC